MRIIVLLALLSTACSAASPLPSERDRSGDRSISARGRAIDGDTVSFDVRLFGADAFERKQLCRGQSGCWQCGKAAQDYAARVLKSGDATIELTGKQSYGRPVGTVSVRGRDLGETMIEAGFAVPATSFLKNDPDRASRYVAAYDRALKARAGAHASYFLDPAKWRHGERLSCEARSREDQDSQGR